MQPDVQLAVMCDPFWSQKTGFCADEHGALVRQNGAVVRVREFTFNQNEWIPGVANKWLFALGFVMTLISLRGLLR